MQRILLITNGPDGIAPMLPNHEVVPIENVVNMLFMLAQDTDFDLILSSVETPELLSHLRSTYPDIPIVILAHQPSIEAAFQAGQLGAADYLPASMDPATLEARVEAAIRQAARMLPKQTDNGSSHIYARPPSDEGPRFLAVHDLRIDRHRRAARFHGKPLKLTRSEFDILALLVENKGRVMPFQEIAFRLQGNYPTYGEARRSLSAHITYLREALKQAGCENYIVNSWGHGYMIESDAEEALRQSEARLRLVLQQMPGMMWSTDTDLKITWAGGTEITSSLKIQPDELVGISLYDLLRGEGPDSPTLQAHERALQGEATSYECQRFDRYYQGHVEPLRDAEGKIIGSIGLALNITERKHAEERLRESEERYRIISGMMLDYVYSVRVLPGKGYKTELDWVAGALTPITGYTVEEAMAGVGWESHVHPDDRLIVEKRRRALLAGKQDLSEFRMIGKHGKTYWLRTYTYPLWDDREGRVARIYAAVKDITEQKEAQEALRRSEERYRAVSEVMSDYAYCFRVLSERETQLEWMTGAYERITGFTIEEAVSGVGWTNIVHPDDRPLVYRRLQKLLTGEKDASEWRIITRNGEVRWLRMYGQPVMEAGRVVRVYAGAQDITERKRVEEALRESETRLHIVLENMPVMVNAFDEQGNIVVWNRECERVTGYSTREIIGNPNAMQALYPDPDYLAQQMAEWEQRGDNYRNWEWNLTAKDGSTKTIAWSNISAQFPVAGWKTWGIGVDVTARRAAEQALRQTQEWLRTVVSNAPIMLWAVDHDGMFTLSEGKALESLGYQPGEEVGKSFFEINRHRPDLLRNIRRALKGETFSAIAEPVKGVVFETHYIPMRDRDGCVSGILGVSVMLTGVPNGSVGV